MVCPVISVDRLASQPVFLVGYGAFNFLHLWRESMCADGQRFWLKRFLIQKLTFLLKF